MKIKKICILILSAIMAISTASCGLHKHEYSNELSFDETHHWNAPVCGCDNVFGNKALHSLSNGACTICGYELEPVLFQNEVFGVGVEKSITLEISPSPHVKSIVYNSADPYISIDNASGTVTGVALGLAEVSATVTYTDNSTSSTRCKVEVNDGSYETLNMKENFVKWVGRNFVYSNAINCFNTASGFETTFYGTQLSANITSAGDQTPSVCVLIDEDTSPAKKVIDLSKTKTSQDILLAEGLTDGYHTVKVYKITEALHGSVAINALETDGFFYTKPAQKELKIEVYGDSISTGYKNLRESLEESNVSNEKMQNGCLTYAWLAAQNLNAEINVFAREGVGMSYSYGASFLMKTGWNKTYCAEKDWLGYNNYNPTWKFDNYVADLVIINVGSNDFWWSSYSESTYKSEIADLCKNLISKHGENVKIILAYGMMTNGNGTPLEELASRQNNVYAVELNKSIAHHPRLDDHQKASITLTNFIQSIL